MFARITAFLSGAIAALAIGSAAQAAPVNYTVTAVATSISAPCSDGFCNALVSGYSPALSTAGSVDVGVTNTFAAFQYDGRVRPSNGSGEEGETLNITASIILEVLETSYTFIANGVINNWSIADTTGVILGGVLQWNSFVIPPGSPLTVLFNTELLAVDGNAARVLSSVTIGASVVPLPGGILLLLTALLGVFGLSRRRNFAAA